ncbi:protein ITPRID1 isoform X2 [Pristis pectinata]|uniref:protein ITPRID1 isoform X2 n=1 Tax=Pristis pectinata TaxID=685728 RepID=UPI00223E4BF7|nr:protein ITPRID1 isoform X2 [Pristis pectinata]
MVMDRNASGEAEKHLLLTHHPKDGDYKQQSIQHWLNTNCTSPASEDRPMSPQKAGIRRRMSSTEDDLMLGIEAMTYPSAIQHMSIKEYVRAFHSENPPLTRLDSAASTTSLNIEPRSVFGFLDRWHSDPEELLLDLGFGKEEPDISTKIPARFINSSSVATGINIRVFLDAQKLRMEMENLDICKITTQNLSPELNVVQVQTLDTKKECGTLLRRISQNSPHKSIKDSQKLEESWENEENTLSSLGKDRKYAFLHAHPFIPEDDSILSPLEVGQNGDQKKAPHLPLDLKMGQDYPLLETSAKDRDAQFLMPQAKRLKRSMCDQLPESFEMEEMQSFDEDCSPRMTANKNCSDVKRENSYQSDSSGFLEEPVIPSQILHAFNTVGCDSVNSQAPLQESKQWPVQIKDPGQETRNITDQTSAPVSVDSDQTKCSEAYTELQVSEGEKKINVENLDHHLHAFGDQQRITVPCVDKVTGEKSELSDNNRHLPIASLKATQHDSVADESFWENNQIKKENGDVDNQNNDTVNSIAVNVNHVLTTQQESSLHLQHPTALSKLVTIQIPQEILQQKNVTEVHSLEPAPLLFQSNEDLSKHSVFKESGKMRDASVQTENNTEKFTIKTSQCDQDRNLPLPVPEFQSGRQFTKSVSVDTGLHIVEQNTQKLTDFTPAHCLCCHHCHCFQHHCSSTWLKANNMECPSKTAVSHSEPQLIKTLQQLQQTARVISGSPQTIPEIETMRKCLQSFRNRLVDIEQDIIEQQASVYSVLTEDEREDVKRLQKLRQAVRQEVTEIEVQLQDQARQVGEAMKVQLQSLLDEQSSVRLYLEVLKQTGDAISDGQLCPSSIYMTSTPAAVTNSQELELNPGTSLSMRSMLGQGPVNSPATSDSNKIDSEACSEAVKDTKLTEKKHHETQTLDFRTILQHIKQSFKQLRLAGPDD